MSYDAVNVYVDLMKSVEDEDASKRELRACVDAWEANRRLLTDAQWEELTMRRTDKVDILLLLRSVVLG